MCGLFGSFGKTLSNSEIINIKKTINHRGPDAAKHLNITDEINATLIHNRLSILDLSDAGHQPMTSTCGRYVIVYNGEIYNFLDLKRDLDNKYGNHNWQSNSDTEVILRGYECEGESFFEELNGMFAFLILDLKRKNIIALRDPFGIKPLFISKQKNTLYFASEIKGFDCIDNFSKTINIQSLKSQLTFMYIPEPDTLFTEIQKLKPGVLYKFDNKNVEERIFFKKIFKTNKLEGILTENEVIEIYRDKLNNSVSRQMISDVTVGAMLSGGLDSSAIVQSVYQSGKTLSAAFTLSTNRDDNLKDQQSDDSTYAKLIAEKFNIPLIEIEAKPNFLDDFFNMSDFFEDGFSDPAALSTYYLCAEARLQGISVLMTGQGADETLFGYRRYQASKWLNMLPYVPGVSKFLDFSPYQINGRFNSTYRRVRRFASLASYNKSERMAQLFTWCDQSIISSVFLDSSPSISYESLCKELNFDNHKSINQKLSKVDLSFDLASLNLAYSDRMSMAASVEARVPFLDFELAQFTLSLPDNFKLRGNTTKYILKKSMEGRLPNDLIYREKAGFSLPVRAWVNHLVKLMGKYLERTFIVNQGIFNYENLQIQMLQLKSGKVDNCYFFLSYFVLQTQIEHYGIS